ncbi:MAG TPA: flagellar FlbD family protein [Candidatus Acidoferrum sp.]|nr:flagellar FlbD family protein [Candidatus Acidoferrum sp.]
MIQLTRLNNQPLVVNSDLIKFVERAPDTVLTLVTGEKIVIRETTEQVLERIVEFRRSILEGLKITRTGASLTGPRLVLEPEAAEGES